MRSRNVRRGMIIDRLFDVCKFEKCHLFVSVTINVKHLLYIKYRVGVVVRLITAHDPRRIRSFLVVRFICVWTAQSTSDTD